MESSVSDELKHRLTLVQRRIVDENRQAIVIFEGRSGRVMGRVINELMNLLEPRGMFYSHFIPESMDSPRSMLRYMSREPAKGVIGIYDRSWYSLLVSSRKTDSTESAMSMERYLAANGVILVKIYLNMSDESIASVAGEFGKERGGKKTFLTDDHIDPKKWKDKTILPMIAATNKPYAPWDIVDVSDLSTAMASVVHTVVSRLSYAMNTGIPIPDSRIEQSYPNPRESADLTLKAVGYKKELDPLMARISELQTKLVESGKSMVLVFEGWDAAGKGGSIKRLVRALNPRGYYIRPVAAPVRDEKLHTYLWRFTNSLPKAGHITVFDRSWYGRMMVEPIEGFCTEAEYSRSADEINTFEKMIHEAGGIIVKFWMEISPEEQLARFNDRADNEFKKWKITDEDWRNREKWDVYCEYVDRMISATNTPYAPWVVVESEDKKYGRLKVLRTVADVLEKELGRGLYVNRR